MLDFHPVQHRHDKVIIIAGGESLTGFDFKQILDFDGAIIAINEAVFHLPRVDYWMTVDPMSPKPQRAMTEQLPGCYYYAAVPELYGTPDNPDRNFRYPAPAGIHYLKRIVPFNGKDYDYTFCENKAEIKTGDSVYGALGLAYHFEAKRVALLGVDGFGKGHWYPEIPYDDGTARFKKYQGYLPVIYEKCIPQLKQRGMQIVNGSMCSKIDCFVRVMPQAALKWIMEAK